MNQNEIKNITFVFSDIENSTRLAQSLRGKYPQLLNQHRVVIREALNRYDGREIDTAGDGFFMTFEHPEQAANAVINMQQRFHEENWAIENGLKVRMSIHTGEALPTDSGYTGVEVHFASRICNVAYGGQVLISKASYMQLKNSSSKYISLQRLGRYALKDFSDSVELFQLKIPGIAHVFESPRIDIHERKLGIIPFEVRGDRNDHDYLGQGFAEELLFALGKVDGLRVASRSSSFHAANLTVNPTDLGQRLSVDSILMGRIDVSNNQLKVSVELLEASTGINIWAQSYEVSMSELTTIERAITARVAEALCCKILPEEPDATFQRQSKNAEAYDFYLRGRRFYQQFSARGVEMALQMFEKAIDADPNYALAYAGMADSYAFLYQHKSPNKDILDKAFEASHQAIKLDPYLAEGHVSQGIILGLRKNFAEAELAFKRAIEIEPSHFLGWYHYARACFAAGKLDKGARLFEHANRVDPEDYQSILLSAQLYNDIGSHDLAQTLRKRGIHIAEKCLELNPGDTRALYLSANALTFLGERKKSLSMLQRALTLEPDDSMVLFNAGCIYALLGMNDHALACLEKSFEAGLTLRGWYENDSNLANLREEPRFHLLLSKLGDDLK